MSGTERFQSFREFYPFYLAEHNKPATFQYPVYSLMGDWVMLKDFLGGKFRKSVTD